MTKGPWSFVASPPAEPEDQVSSRNNDLRPPLFSPIMEQTDTITVPYSRSPLRVVMLTCLPPVDCHETITFVLLYTFIKISNRISGQDPRLWFPNSVPRSPQTPRQRGGGWAVSERRGDTIADAQLHLPLLLHREQPGSYVF